MANHKSSLKRIYQGAQAYKYQRKKPNLPETRFDIR